MLTVPTPGVAARRSEMRIELMDQLGTVVQAHQVVGLLDYPEAHFGMLMRKGIRHSFEGQSGE
ncbi:MAG: hypothetical protein LAT65_17205 [Saccharospirillum sp.]|nr:hypothetical protein [Saccharospirillum sp.]